MRKVLIFGDSYSTFNGYIPDGYATYYPKLNVNSVGETWWKQLLQKMNGNLLENNSWSGSTISYTGWNNQDSSKTSSFICRYRQLKDNGFFVRNKVDTLFVFGGTNDSWCGAPLGEMQFSDWEEQDLFSVLPAICYFAQTLKNDLPNTEIIFILNTNLKEEIQTCMEEVSKRYGVKLVRLLDIDKECAHPTKQGMRQIASQVFETISTREE